MEKTKEFVQYINTSVHRPIAGSSGATVIPSPMQIQAITDTPFVMCMTMGFVATDAVGTAFVIEFNYGMEPPVLVYWSTSAQQTWFNSQASSSGVPMSTLYGTGQLPHYLKQPLVLANNTILNVNACNLTAATNLYLYCVHEGYNSYPGDNL